MSRKVIRWTKWSMTGCLGGAMVFQVGCMTGEEMVRNLITAGITSAIQVISNSVFFALDNFLISVT